MQEELLRRCAKYARHLSALCEVSVAVMDTGEKELRCMEAAHFCARCTCERCSRVFTHLYGASESFRWNGKYTYYCPMGLIFVAAAVSDDAGVGAGALVAGPMVMGALRDTLLELPEGCDDMRQRVAFLRVMPASRVTHLAEVAAAVAEAVSAPPSPRAAGILYEQDKILNAIYSAGVRQQAEGGGFVYPIEYEKRLQGLIAARDKQGALTLLNELFGYIFLTDHCDTEAIKARVLELVVVLSRAAIDAGADAQEILMFNNNYIHKIESLSSIEEISMWTSGITHRFIGYTFDYVQVKHSDVVYKAMEYIRAHFADKITLDDIAKHVCLSRSYLSSIFKEETGQSLFSYLNRVRVDKSKLLLLDNQTRLADVAGLCGFEDQSYYTKVFKKLTGVSPKRFRDSRGACGGRAEGSPG